MGMRGVLLLLGLVAALPAGADELEDATRALYRGEPSRAATIAEAYVKSHPNVARARIVLARAEVAQGRLDAAFLQFRAALQLQPDNPDGLYYLGRLSGILAQQEYKRLFAIAPESARVHQLMAEAALAQKDTAQAEAEYRAALGANPNSVSVLDALGDLMRSQARLDQAASFYRKAAELDSRDYDSAYGLGACELARGAIDSALAHFRHAASLDPNSAAARFAVGTTLIRLDRYAEAIAELKAAIALEPDFRQAYTHLGRAHRKLGDAAAAAAAFQKARELFQNESDERQKFFERQHVVPLPDAGVETP